MILHDILRDRAFNWRLISLTLPISLQSLMLALVAAADALMTPIQTALQLNQELTNHSDKVYKNAWQQIKDREVWNDRPDGLILLSDRKDLTKAFDSGKWKESRTENRGNWKYLTEYLLRVM